MIFVLVSILIILNPYQSFTSVDVEDETYMITIKVTQDFGKSTMFSNDITVENGDSAMDALDKVADATYNYGGGFVESINGVKSQYTGGKDENKDWFYYINGVLGNVGALQYKLYPGDVEHWDFHSWSSDRIVTAIIGDYPEPFLHGLNGDIKETIVVYSDFFYDNAYMLQQSLERLGISPVLKRFDEISSTEKSDSNLILVDTFDNELILEMNSNAQNLGWFVEYADGGLVTFTDAGEDDHRFDHGGVIVASQNPWNPKGNWNSENVVWVISGVTKDDVYAAMELLIDSPGSIEDCVGIVISDDDIYKVP